MTTANKQVYFDDVEVGMDIPNLIKGPMTQAHITVSYTHLTLPTTPYE